MRKFLGAPAFVPMGETTAQLDDVYSYGNFSLRQGITVLSPKRGKSLGASGGGWTHLVYTVSHGGPDVTLAAGTEPLSGSIIG